MSANGVRDDQVVRITKQVCDIHHSEDGDWHGSTEERQGGVVVRVTRSVPRNHPNRLSRILRKEDFSGVGRRGGAFTYVALFDRGGEGKGGDNEAGEEGGRQERPGE